MRGDLARRQSSRLGPGIEKAIDKNGCGVTRRQWHLDAQLVAPPNCPVEQFCMIRRGSYQDIARQLIQLHKQERNDAFDFAGLVDVATLFADGIELVEEQDAGRCADIFEEPCKPRIGLAEVSADKGVIADCE